MAAVKDFSVEEKLSSLILIQKIDSKLDEIQILKGELPIEVKDLEDEIEGLHARQTRIEEEINGIQDFIAQRQEGIKNAKALIAKYEKQSDNVKNNREFEAINKEIEMQQLEEKLCEKHIKDATEEMADKVRQLDLAKKAVGSKESNLSAKKGELEKIIQETEKEETFLSEKSAEYQGQIEERLLAAYNRIRTSVRNGLAVVSIERGASAGSFFTIPPQTQVEIASRKKIITDEHSGRILVDASLAEEEREKMEKLFAKM